MPQYVPADDQATVFLLKPGKCALHLKSRYCFLDRSAAMFLRLPDLFQDSCLDPTLPYLLPEGFRIIAFIRRDDVETFARATPCAGVDFDRLEQWHHLGPLIPIGRRGAVRQGHAVLSITLRIMLPLPFPPQATPSPPPLPGGKSAVNGAIRPVNHPLFFCNAQNPGLHGDQSAICLPTLQPAMRGTL